MVQGGRCLGFTLKSKKGLGVACQRVGEKLQCNEPVEASVLGLVDDSHAPAAHLFQNVVVRDVLVDQGERNPCRAMVGRCPCEVKRLGTSLRPPDSLVTVRWFLFALVF